MTSPIDPIRRTSRMRRSERPRQDERNNASQLAEDRSVPVVIEQVSGPEPEQLADGASTFSAHLMGQSGQKRGLRGGPLLIDAAQGAYKSVEYSGPAERRARLGQVTKTEV
jgi:hypothetical protein